MDGIDDVVKVIHDVGAIVSGCSAVGIKALIPVDGTLGFHRVRGEIQFNLKEQRAEY